MDSNKRTRSKNFTEKDKDTLLILIEEYQNIIENKKSDCETLKSKNAAWEEICVKFNAATDTARSVQSIKTFYDNFKMKLRKKKAEDNNNSWRKTGGGPYKKSKLDENEERLLENLNQQFTPLHNAFDSAADYFASTSTTFEVVNNILVEEQAPTSKGDISVEYIPLPTDAEQQTNCSLSVAEPPQLKNNTVERKSSKNTNSKPAEVYSAILNNNKSKYALNLSKEKFIEKYNDLKLKNLEVDFKLKNLEFEEKAKLFKLEREIHEVKLRLLQREEDRLKNN